MSHHPVRGIWTNCPLGMKFGTQATHTGAIGPLSFSPQSDHFQGLFTPFIGVILGFLTFSIFMVLFSWTEWSLVGLAGGAYYARYCFSYLNRNLSWREWCATFPSFKKINLIYSKFKKCSTYETPYILTRKGRAFLGERKKGKNERRIQKKK
jgi:hypothetical protein